MTQSETLLREALSTIEGQALCYGMRADEAELRDWLKFIAETATTALSIPRLEAGRVTEAVIEAALNEAKIENGEWIESHKEAVKIGIALAMSSTPAPDGEDLNLSEIGE